MPFALGFGVTVLCWFALLMTIRWYCSPIDEKNPQPLPTSVLVCLGVALWLILVFG